MAVWVVSRFPRAAFKFEFENIFDKIHRLPKTLPFLSPRVHNYRGDNARVGDSSPHDGNSVFDLTVAPTLTLTPLAQSKPASLSALCHQRPLQNHPT
jgi:hypothetical protein